MNNRKRKSYHSLSRRHKHRILSAINNTFENPNSENEGEKDSHQDDQTADNGAYRTRANFEINSEANSLSDTEDARFETPVYDDSDENNETATELNTATGSGSKFSSDLEIGSDAENGSLTSSTNEEIVQDHNVETRIKIISCQSNCASQLKTILTKWAIEEKSLNNSTLTNLLTSLHEYFPSIPQTAATLKSNVDRKFDIEQMSNGEYVHFKDWITDLRELLELNYSGGLKEVNLVVNIDGIPLYNNTLKYTAYPILLSPIQYPFQIFCVGIYCSNKAKKKSMPNVNIMLEKLLSDFTKLGGHLNTKLGSFTVFLGPFVCDAPCRSDLKQIISHTGYNSCERCVQHGIHKDGRVLLPDNSCLLRTDQSFQERSDPGHHRVVRHSILESIGYPMVSGFVLDYMHLCCIGIMKRLMVRWVKSPKNTKKVHLSVHVKTIFDEKCNDISSHISKDFNRKCEGGLSGLSYWKATEFRLFLLYVGPVLLANRDIFSKPFHENFLCFSVAMHILLQDNQLNNMDFTATLLKKFITGATNLYGHSILSYNVHAVQHLVDDYRKYGSLDKISAFKYESYLGAHIKGAVHSGFKPLQQVSNHVNLKNTVRKKYTRVTVFNTHSPKPKLSTLSEGQCFAKLLGEKSFVKRGKLGDKDNTVLMKNGRIAIVKDIFKVNETISVVVQYFDSTHNLFKRPINSTEIGIYKVQHLQNEKLDTPENFAHKIMLLPFKEKFVACRLHTFFD